MRLLRGAVGSVSPLMFRRFAAQMINLVMAIITAWIIWKIFIWLTGIQSPITVVISGSMEPSFRRGDILLLHMNDAPIRAGEIVLFNLEVHEQVDTGEINILTKGDNNREDDTYGIYGDGQVWLQRSDIIGRAAGSLPYLGWVTIILKEYRVCLTISSVFTISSSIFALLEQRSQPILGLILLSGAFIWQAITVSVDADESPHWY